MPEKNEDKSHRFISETIVGSPNSKERILRRLILTVFCAALFGVVAAVCFAVSLPFVQKGLRRPPRENTQITIPRDEAETSAAETTESGVQAQTEGIDEVVRSEMEKYKYSYTIEDFNAMYDNLRTIADRAGDGVVAVHSIQHQTDWFDNPIETTGQFAGVIIVKTEEEVLILTPDQAVETADSIEVVFKSGTSLPGVVYQKDAVSRLAVVGVDITSMSEDQKNALKEISLGNSYAVKQGDAAIAVGGPAGMVRSTDYGFISYVVKNVQTVDGMARVFYTSLRANASVGTFVLNTRGELIGWVTDAYDSGSMTAFASISDYKGILQNLTNGLPASYFGVKGQEVSSELVASGLPDGIYVTECVGDSPAYNAGIQNGDIILQVDGVRVEGTMKEFQNQIEALVPGDKVKVVVARGSREAYTEITFEVTIGARG